MPLDIALAYDPANRCCDLVFNGRDFALDTSFVTPVLMSLGCDRRAHPDDALPQVQQTMSPAAPLINARRGWAGDGLDPRGELTGGRGWVLSQEKETEATRQLALSIDQEALAWISTRLGVAMTIAVEWVQRNMLGHRITIGSQTIVVPQVIGQ